MVPSEYFRRFGNRHDPNRAIGVLTDELLILRVAEIVDEDPPRGVEIGAIADPFVFVVGLNEDQVCPRDAAQASRNVLTRLDLTDFRFRTP